MFAVTCIDVHKTVLEIIVSRERLMIADPYIYILVLWRVNIMFSRLSLLYHILRQFLP